MSYKSRDRDDFRRLYRTLLDEFGEEKGLRIIEVLTMELGGRRVTIPGHRALARDLRVKRIHELYDDGFSVDVLARRFGITTRQVEYDLKHRTMVPEV